MTNDANKAGDESGAWAELRRIRDEVKVKLHLAGMELKQRWDAFEPRIQAVQGKVEQKSEQAADAVQTQVLHLVDGLRQFLDDLRKDIDGSKKKAAGEPGGAGANASAGTNGAPSDGDADHHGSG